MHESANLCFPRLVWVGEGAARHLGEEAGRLGRRALLVTGRSALREAGITDRLVGELQRHGVEVEFFEEVPPEPDVAVVDRARQRLREAKCDLVVEAGGGSAMDVGKAAAALAGVEARTVQYHSGKEAPHNGLPHIAVPTTAGTGSEATPNSVLIDRARELKASVRGRALLPVACIVDGDLTLSCPPQVTAASGMDALAQAIESYLSVNSIPTTEALSLRAVSLVASRLPQAYRCGGDRQARHAVMEGSFLAGMALANASLGAVHGLAHPLGLLYGAPHGEVCAALLPHVLRENAPGAPQKYGRLREALGGDPCNRIRELLHALNLEDQLGPYPDEEWRGHIMHYALSSGSSRANPVSVDEGYVERILRAVCR